MLMARWGIPTPPWVRALASGLPLGGANGGGGGAQQSGVYPCVRKTANNPTGPAMTKKIQARRSVMDESVSRF
jgi:hypothetical protein